MKELLSKIADIGEKADYLSQKSQLLLDDNLMLRSRITDLETNIEQHQKELRELADQHEMLKLARSVESRDQEATDELKRKINEYIREIDQCLKLIGD